MWPVGAAGGNGLIESLNGKLREECLNPEICVMLEYVDNCWHAGVEMAANNGPTVRPGDCHSGNTFGAL
jgi:hypothetical protein